MHFGDFIKNIFKKCIFSIINILKFWLREKDVFASVIVGLCAMLCIKTFHLTVFEEQSNIGEK
jgi:hypothetical protein